MDLTRVHNFDTVESGHTHTREISVMLPGSVYFSKKKKRQAELTQKAEARRKKEAADQAAKQKAESTQEADARRKKEAEALVAKRQAESIQEADTRRVAKTQAAKRQVRSN